MSSTEKNSDRIARLNRQVEELQHTVRSLSSLVKSNRDQNRQVIWARIDSFDIGNRWKATSLDIYDRTSANSLPKRSGSVNLYVHAIGSSNPHVGDVVAVANIRGIWTIVNPPPSGELYFAHFRSDQNTGLGGGSQIGWKDPSLISAGTTYDSLYPFDWSSFAAASIKIDTGAFSASPSTGELVLKTNYQPGQREIYHVEWSGTFHHGLRENFTTTPTNVPSSEVAFSIRSGAATQDVLDSHTFIRQPWVMDDDVADEIHYEHDAGMGDEYFKKLFQIFEPIQFKFHAAIPHDELDGSRTVFQLHVADISKTRPADGVNPAPVDPFFYRARITGSTIRIYST